MTPLSRDQSTAVRLTKQQKAALGYLLLQGEAHDYWMYDYTGYQAWPTMNNLVKKGLVENVSWEEYSYEERGYVRKLTHDGYRLARQLAEVSR